MAYSIHSYQNFNYIFTELEIISKINAEVQGTTNSLQKEQCFSYQQDLISNYTTEPK